MMATKAAAAMVSVRYRPMKSSCAAKSSPIYRNTSTTCSLLDESVVSSTIIVKNTALWNLFSNMAQDLLSHDREQLILHLM